MMTLRTRQWWLGGALALLSGCAGGTLGSGVGDRYLEHPPWEAGHEGPLPERVGYFPVVYQRGATQPALFDPEGAAGTPVAALIEEMNAWLAGRTAVTAIKAPGVSPGRGPDVQFSCRATSLGDCVTEEVGKPEMRLAVTRPSGDWTAWAAQAMEAAGVDAALLLTLEVGQYMPRQRNILGAKEVELGLDYSVSLPWLTSLETPVSVLQLTAALVARNGLVLRIASEGLLARRTSLPASSIGLQALITDEEVGRLRAARREDLRGGPLVWQAALQGLLARVGGVDQ